MKYVVLDTSFILSCIRKKIDFFEQISLMGMKAIIPKQVIKEIRMLSDSKQEAKIAVKILEKNDFRKITLRGKITDNGIIHAAEENEEWIVATLDKEIKDRTKNPKLVIRGEKELEVI